MVANVTNPVAIAIDIVKTFAVKISTSIISTGKA